MGDYWSTAPNPNIREVKLGDASAASETQQNATAAPPTLKKPGETLPSDDRIQQMQKVQFPPGMDGSNKTSGPAGVPSGGGAGTPPGPGSSQYSSRLM
jgi:hypothetical protein